ncbi:cyclic GMP-AMP synthase-like receptor 3 [Glandiceps talaboti]
MKVWIGQDGPAMKVMAIYHSQYNEEKYLKIDLVPAIANNNRYYVAKPNRYDTTEGAQGKWRASFSEQEKKKIEYAKEDQKVVLRIMKAFCKKDSPLAYIDSYYLKTVFLHMLDEHPESWSDVEKYVKAFLQRLLGYIKQGHLPHYCNQEYNLITHFLDEHITVDNITRRIERLLLMNDDKLIQILQR